MLGNGEGTDISANATSQSPSSSITCGSLVVYRATVFEG